MQSHFKCLGDIKDIVFGQGINFTREPWPLLDATGSELILCNNVTLSSGVQIFTHGHQFDKRNWRNLPKIQFKEPTMIGENAFLGVNAIVVHTCKYIGTNSVIGANSVVTKDVPDNEIWAGNPAKKIGEVE